MTQPAEPRSLQSIIDAMDKVLAHQEVRIAPTVLQVWRDQLQALEARSAPAVQALMEKWRRSADGMVSEIDVPGLNVGEANRSYVNGKARALRSCADELAALVPREGPQPSREDLLALCQRVHRAFDDYVDWHGAVHVDGCPEDDTCDCGGKPLNDLVNAALTDLERVLEGAALPREGQEPQPENDADDPLFKDWEPEFVVWLVCEAPARHRRNVVDSVFMQEDLAKKRAEILNKTSLLALGAGWTVYRYSHLKPPSKSGAALGRPDGHISDDDEPLHTGDDDRLDALTSIRASAESIIEEETRSENFESAQAILEDCDTLDQLILATIQRERALGRPDGWAEERSFLIAALAAARDALVAFQKQAGALPQGGYATTLTEAEMRVARAVADLDKILAGVAGRPDGWQDREMLQLCERIARRAHEGQTEESTGDDYIHHVERVVALVETPEEKAVAWLHDVLEDADLTPLGLSVAGVPDRVVRAVEYLTRAQHCEGGYVHEYAEYIDGISRCDALVIAVKLADLRDHLRPNCPERLRPRYEKALATLEAVSPVRPRQGEHTKS